MPDVDPDQKTTAESTGGEGKNKTLLQIPNREISNERCEQGEVSQGVPLKKKYKEAPNILSRIPHTGGKSFLEIGKGAGRNTEHQR